jgi:plastocyanin
VTVSMNNQDAFVPHDLSIPGIASIPSCTGPCTGGPVTFTAPAPGNYPFLCTVHPDMTGTLRVSP